MHILVAGVRQKNAPIEVREQFSLTQDEIELAHKKLLQHPSIRECAILSTCNRTEIYTTVTDTKQGLSAIKDFFREHKGICYDTFRPHVFSLLHEDAVLHLFRVASGLDSLILGEGQILGQVKDTLKRSRQYKASGTMLDKAFHSAITLGKRVRSETGIASKDISVSRAAFDYIQDLDKDCLNKKIAVLGGGSMAALLMQALTDATTNRQRQNITIVNRSETRLQTLSEKFNLQGVTWNQIDSVIADTDILFVATGAPHFVLYPEQFEDVGNKIIMDISVPRNVSPEVGKLPYISLINTDGLEGIGEFSQSTEAELLSTVQAILDDEYAKFYQWFISLPAIPTITSLRSKMETIREQELATMAHQSDEVRSAAASVSRSIINKMLHDPMVQLKKTTNRDEIHERATTLKHLFNISEAVH